MSDDTEVKVPARKKPQAKKKPASPRAPTPDKFAGMSVKDCCSACNASACVISGKPYCAHPRKGGLHPEEMSDPATLNRRKEAENRLRDQLLPVR